MWAVVQLLVRAALAVGFADVADREAGRRAVVYVRILGAFVEVHHLLEAERGVFGWRAELQAVFRSSRHSREAKRREEHACAHVPNASGAFAGRRGGGHDGRRQPLGQEGFLHIRHTSHGALPPRPGGCPFELARR